MQIHLTALNPNCIGWFLVPIRVTDISISSVNPYILLDAVWYSIAGVFIWCVSSLYDMWATNKSPTIYIPIGDDIDNYGI